MSVHILRVKAMKSVEHMPLFLGLNLTLMTSCKNTRRGLITQMSSEWNSGLGCCGCVWVLRANVNLGSIWEQ